MQNAILFDAGALGRRIRDLRKASGWTQADLGGHVGVRQPTVSSWEAAETTPDAPSILALAQAFNVSPLWLLTEMGPREFAPDAPARKLELIRVLLATPLEDDASTDLAKLTELVDEMARREGKGRRGSRG